MPDTLKIEVHRQDNMGNVYRLLQNLHFPGLEVPAGFESDGASVPRFFWRIVFPPGDTRALYAAFLHNYVYRTHPAGWTKPLADCAFRVLLIAGGIGRFRAWLAWLGVALFGRKNYDRKGESK